MEEVVLMGEALARVARSIPRAGSRLTDTKAAQLRRAVHIVLELSGHPQEALPDHVLQALSAAAADNMSAPSRGLLELRTAIADHVNRLSPVSFDAEEYLLVTSGAMQALSLVFRALLDPGDEVLIPSPCFFFGGMIELAGGRARYVAMDESDGFRWDLGRIEEAISPRTKVLVINSPVNPTGYVLTPEECQGLADLALRHNLMVVSDEAYERFVFDHRPYTSMLNFADVLGDRLIVIRSFSKSYALANWRVGYLLAAPRFVDVCTKLLEWEQLTCSAPCQAGAAAAMTGPQDWMDEVSHRFTQRGDALWQALQEIPAISAHLPMGGPFLFVNTAQLGESSAAVAEYWLSAHGIPTTPGEAFQATSHLRLAFGMRDDAVMDELIRAKPAAAKGRYIRSVTFASTMGPGIKVDPSRTRDIVEEPVPA